MLALRLVRGSHPPALLRRLLVAAAAGGVGYLLLSALSFALAHPGRPEDAVVRLLWCLVPLATAVQFAVAVARTEPGRPGSGLDLAGMGPGRRPLLAAVSTALWCVLGSVPALLIFLNLRDGSAGRLPVAGMLTLLCVVPAVASAASALATRPRAAAGRRQPQTADRPGRPGGAAGAGGSAAEPAAPASPFPSPSGLPWGAALAALGLALETFAAVKAADAGREPALVPLPGALGGNPAGLIGGWLLTALGLVLAGPGLVHLCGRLVATGCPGAVRLLAGRMLQAEAVRIGRPLGVLCAVASGALAAAELYGTAPAGGAGVFGPLTALGAAVVMGCATGSALTAAAAARADRVPATEALLQLGASRSFLRSATALRTAALLVVLCPVTWAVGRMAALPLGRVGG